jgi:hypothetical protein
MISFFRRSRARSGCRQSRRPEGTIGIGSDAYSEVKRLENDSTVELAWPAAATFCLNASVIAARRRTHWRSSRPPPAPTSPDSTLSRQGRTHSCKPCSSISASTVAPSRKSRPPCGRQRDSLARTGFVDRRPGAYNAALRQ